MEDMGSQEDQDAHLVTTTKLVVVKRQALAERMGEHLLFPALPSKPADLPALILELLFSKGGVEQNAQWKGCISLTPGKE